MSEKYVKHSIIGLVYDFDGTLSPNNMQEDTIFPAYGIDQDAIWKKADQLVREEGYERTLAYLKLLIHDEAFAKKPLKRADLKKLAADVTYYPGVTSFFERLQTFIESIPEVREWGITLEHYIVSSGMKEILEGTEIYPYFKRVYACEYDYDENGPIFPKLVINDTNKTQFLFRINKGKLDLNEDINTHMPESERRIPFKNLIYIGDSSTDIPAMTVTQKLGGQAIAVFDPGKGLNEKVKNLVVNGRVGHFVPADFREDQLLVKILQTTLKKIIYNISYDGSSQMSKGWIENNG